MMVFREWFRGLSFWRVTHLPVTCYAVAYVLSLRFQFPLFATTVALVLAVQAYERMTYKGLDE